MGKEKAGFLTPKAIANRIKAKGLQKLRWYCQMCQKQCRDENGFKCHCLSESHQRQLLLASENPENFMDFYSNEFLSDFMELLSRRFGTKRVHNNMVYNEYISHREHVHMNSTKWETLTDLTKWLGREGYCKVDETPKGWYIQYIDRDPETIRRQQELDKKKKQDVDDEERAAKFIEEQVRRGKEGLEEQEETSVYTELKRESESQLVTFSMGAGTSSSSASLRPSALASAIQPGGSTKRKEKGPVVGEKDGKKKKSALDDIMEMEEQKRKVQRSDYWLHPGIVVKVITKKLGDRYFKKKAVVQEVQGKYVAVVRMTDSGDKLKVDQMHVETVLPALGRKVLVLNGGYRGLEAVFNAIHEDRFCVSITIDSGPLKGRKLDNIPYEDISKLA
uniref:DNA/RNA-binding protein KIN17 isoform X1 n=1 Tax=Petromyzon marinus TaxID=7757 RepID=A0AAJ7TLW6_PETMA|nr:DNA/RNA-binding protein KIN17 isoform X1 [Petromyzon marinus]